MDFDLKAKELCGRLLKYYCPPEYAAAKEALEEAYSAGLAEREKVEAVVEAAKKVVAKLRSAAADPDTIYRLDQKLCDAVDILDADSRPTGESK